MKIEHVALWAKDMERICAFYETYFDACRSARYVNQRSGFESYFLTLSSGARIEVMQRPDVRMPDRDTPAQEFMGYAHIALALGSPEAVDERTVMLQASGYTVLSGPRRTGDGYYESVVLDPEGNRVELTV